MRLLAADLRHVSPAEVRAAGADLVCGWGAPRFLRWRSRAAALARSSELTYVCGGGTTGGVVLLAALRLRVLSVRELPHAAVALVEVGGVRWAVAAAGGGAASDEAWVVARDLGELCVLVLPSGVSRTASGGAVAAPVGGGVWELAAPS